MTANVIQSNSEPRIEPPVLEFRDLSLSFDGTPALCNVSFQLNRGQMIVITGVSGSGKSVLLHVAIGLLEPDEGMVLIEGRDVERLSETELLALRSASMGLAFQTDTLFTGMTVYDNAAYRLVEHGWSDEDTDGAVREILSFVGLGDDAEKLPEELSIGMRRRLEIARALAGWPPIMLFDEPTSGLDPINSRLILDLLIRARDVHRISSLCATKEVEEIEYLAKHRSPGAAHQSEVSVMLLDKGKIAFFGGLEGFHEDALPRELGLWAQAGKKGQANSAGRDPWGHRKRSEVRG